MVAFCWDPVLESSRTRMLEYLGHRSLFHFAHPPFARSGPAQCKRQGPGFQRLTIRPDDALQQLHFQCAEPLERLRELQLEDAVWRRVLKRELGDRRRRLAAL